MNVIEYFYANDQRKTDYGKHNPVLYRKKTLLPHAASYKKGA